MEKKKAKGAIERKLRTIVADDSKIDNAYLLVYAPKQGIHWSMAYGKTGEAVAHHAQPYHAASIGKTFTAIVIAMLVEENKLGFHDPIIKYLPEEITKNLHLYKGKDYSQDIRIEHLLKHTSGLPDYYEDKPIKGAHFLDIILEDQHRAWTAQETIEWTKKYYKSHFPVGKGIHYSNTGYNLLGLIIEKVTAKPYHQVLQEYLFDRLEMKHTYLSQYGEPAEKSNDPIARVNIKGKSIAVEAYASLSSLYASGQVVSTSEDLLKFMKALTSDQLIQRDTLLKMQQWKKLWMGVDYGYGLMRIRMLPFIEKYNVWGHLGSISSFMLYNPAMNIYIMGSFNKAGYLSKSIRFAFGVLRTLSRINNPSISQ